MPRAEVNNYQDVGGTTIGPSYWDLCKNFPNAKYIIQTPLAIADVEETVLWATTVVDAIGIDAIYGTYQQNTTNLRVVGVT